MVFTIQKKKNLLYLGVALLVSLFTLYFSASMVTGKRSLSALIRLKKDIEHNKILLKSISFEREKLSNKILGLYEKSLDLDLLDEQAKNSLGYASPNEFMIILDIK